MIKQSMPNFYSVIPSYVRYDKELTSFEKLIYSEIVALTNYKGYCYAYNKYFAYVYNVSERTVIRAIKNLEKKDYIKINIIKNEKTNQILERKIYISEVNTPTDKNVSTPTDKNVRVARDSNNKNIKRFNNNYIYNKYSFKKAKPDIKLDWLDEYIANME